MSFYQFLTLVSGFAALVLVMVLAEPSALMAFLAMAICAGTGAAMAIVEKPYRKRRD